MDTSDPIAQIWVYLPAFQAVAETQHLPTASRRLGLSPSSLSRTIKQLEAKLGVPLFTRQRRRLALNARGRQLLEASRQARGHLSGAVQELLDVEPHGPLHVACSTAVIPFLLQPALADLRRLYPRVTPQLHAPGTPREVYAALRSGAVHLALLAHPAPTQDLLMERLLTLDYGVYCGHGHPLYAAEDPGPEQVLQHAFIGPTLAEEDRFPRALRPNVQLRVYQMQSAMSFCASGEYLAVLPDRVVHAWHGAHPLRRITNMRLPPGAVHVVFSPDHVQRQQDPPALLLEQLRRRAELTE